MSGHSALTSNPSAWFFWADQVNERDWPHRRLLKEEYAVQSQKTSDSRNRNCISVAGPKEPEGQILISSANLVAKGPR